MVKVELLRANGKGPVRESGVPWKKSTQQFFPEKSQEDLESCDQYFFIHTFVSLGWSSLPLTGSSRKHIK